MSDAEWYGAGENLSQEDEAIKDSEFVTLRYDLEEALTSARFSGFELFGAGAEDEELSPAEYAGALRVVGPNNPRRRKAFVRLVKNIAIPRGFNVEEDRPPSVTHLFGTTIKKRSPTPKRRVDAGELIEPSNIAHRPFLYIYKSYRHYFPSSHELEAARRAGLHTSEIPVTGYRVYESTVNEVADNITDNPNMFQDEIPELVARQICDVWEFKLLKEEIIDASDNLESLVRSICVPITVGDTKSLAYVMAESINGNVRFDLVTFPPVNKNRVLNILSSLILR